MNRKGFSLIELLIVITIIGILAVIFLPRITEGPARARDAERISTVTDLANAIELFAQDNNRYPITSGTFMALDTDSTNTDVAALASYFDNGEIPNDPDSTNKINDANAGFYVYRDWADGFIVAADLEKDKFEGSYYTADSIFNPSAIPPAAFTPTEADLAEATHVGENNVYAYYK